jgi:hypothetical protein
MGIDDAIPTRSSSTIQNSSGGFSVAWSEENTRDSIFSALKRKETYGTSGTRPVVRFFGGWNFPKNLCKSEFVTYGYKNGVPMGGDLSAQPSYTNSRGPTFIAAAWKDNFINTPLQQIDIIKGWIDVHNITHEEVFTIAGKKKTTLGVNKQCEATTTGPAELCAVWQDPDFNAAERAFYYVRVLETPVCRYSTLMCQANYGLNPLIPSECNKQLATLAASKNPLDQSKASNGAACCSNETTSTFLQPVIQERAWTSPIWYTP